MEYLCQVVPPISKVRFPLHQVQRLCVRQLEVVADGIVCVLICHHNRHLPDVADVVHIEHMGRRHLAKQCQLGTHGGLEGLLRPAGQQIGRHAQRPQDLHAVLGGLGLLLAYHAQHRHQADVDHTEVVGAHPELKLPQCLDERHGLDVSHGAAKLDDTNIWRPREAIHRYMCHLLNPILNGICDVRHHLNSLTQVVASPLLFDDGLVDLPCSQIIVPLQLDVQKPFVVAKIQIDLTAVIQHEHLPMLKGRHCPSISIQVGINFDRCHSEATSLQQDAGAAGGDALAQPAHHATRHQHILHCVSAAP
mmetsp:Transcript_468/g.1420  ORF Transcript_468/g.1420 Transcript_468/m.1420 type:complete len:306 (-) Transcript_468:195-1112(-)